MKFSPGDRCVIDGIYESGTVMSATCNRLVVLLDCGFIFITDYATPVGTELR